MIWRGYPGPQTMRKYRNIKNNAHPNLLNCHSVHMLTAASFARCFPCRLRSINSTAWLGVGLLGHEQIGFPFDCLGVWHFTLRFVLPGVGLATRAEGRKAVACSRPLDPKST
jgi:hypothetical protein